MDLTNRKAAGEHVDSKNIKKHKNDIFRLTELIDPAVKITAPQGVYTDVQEFVQRMQSESIDMKQLGLIGRTKDRILDELKDLYIAQWLIIRLVPRKNMLRLEIKRSYSYSDFRGMNQNESKWTEKNLYKPKSGR